MQPCGSRREYRRRGRFDIEQAPYLSLESLAPSECVGLIPGVVASAYNNQSIPSAPTAGVIGSR